MYVRPEMAVRPAPVPLAPALPSRNLRPSYSLSMPSPRPRSRSTVVRGSRYPASISGLPLPVPVRQEVQQVGLRVVPMATTMMLLEMLHLILLLPPAPAPGPTLLLLLRPTTGPIGATSRRGCALPSMPSRMPSSPPSCRPGLMPLVGLQVPPLAHRPVLSLVTLVRVRRLPFLPDSAAVLPMIAMLVHLPSVLRGPELLPPLHLAPVQ